MRSKDDVIEKESTIRRIQVLVSFLEDWRN